MQSKLSDVDFDFAHFCNRLAPFTMISEKLSEGLYSILSFFSPSICEGLGKKFGKRKYIKISGISKKRIYV